MKIKSLIGTVFVFYLILMIGFNEPAYATIIWTIQASGGGSTMTDISAVNANTVWATDSGGAIRHTTDGGATWTGQSSGISSLQAISAVDANNAWAVGFSGGGAIRHTTNGGATWTGQTSGTGNGLNGVFAVDANTAWVVSTSGDILYTTNGGTTWTAQTSGTTSNLFDVAAVDANTAWVVGANGLILHTTNAGITWTAQSSGTTNDLNGVSAVDANTAWAVGESGTIRHTTNAGASWTGQSSGTGVFLSDVSAVDANTAWAVGFSGTIRHTTDGGATWFGEVSGDTGQIRGLSAVDANIVYATSNFGVVLKGVSDSILTAQMTLAGVCEVDLASGTLNFVAGDPISNGAGVGTGEIEEDLTNTLGNLQSQVGVFGTDWTDGGALTIMLGSHTVVDTVGTGVFGDKTPLSTNSGSPTALGNIAPQGTITTFWDAEVVMDGGNPGYSGPIVQTITVDFTCV